MNAWSITGLGAGERLHSHGVYEIVLNFAFFLSFSLAAFPFLLFSDLSY